MGGGPPPPQSWGVRGGAETGCFAVVRQSGAVKCEVAAQAAHLKSRVFRGIVMSLFIASKYGSGFPSLLYLVLIKERKL
jgi:hypothetical protein